MTDVAHSHIGLHTINPLNAYCANNKVNNSRSEPQVTKLRYYQVTTKLRIPGQHPIGHYALHIQS